MALALALAACAPPRGNAPGAALAPSIDDTTADREAAPDLLLAPEVAVTPLDAAATAPDAGVAPTMRDWQAHPAVLQAGMPSDLWVLGDVHGDVDRLATLLLAAGVAQISAQPQQATWQAGPATLVVMGDMIDKGKQALAVLAALRELQSQAPSQGGAVLVLLGNHEAEFLADPVSAKVGAFVDELSKAGIDPNAVAAGQHPLGQWLRNLPMGLRMGPWFFCHAGDTHGLTLTQLQTAIQQGVTAEGFAAPVLLADDSLLEARLEPPWWETPGADPEQALTARAAALGVQHLVQGHQPGKVKFGDGTTRKAAHLFQKYGRIFLVDAGMSAAVDDSQGALLHIRHDAAGDQAFIVKPDGSTKLLWSGL